jgi:uncharacterized membrane protein
MQKSFIKFFDKAEQSSYEGERKNQRFIFFIVRASVFLLLLIAIASPFIMETSTVKGNPRITILTDGTLSMDLFEQNLGIELANKLKNKIPASVRHVVAGDKSAIGDGILNNLERDENVIVITDGNNNDGKLLGDIMLLANSLNATVSTLDMEVKNSDVGVEIIGPNEAILDTEETFIVNVNHAGDAVPYNIEVKYDDEIVIAKSNDKADTFTLNRKLSEGYHKITAELLDVGNSDHFSQNNKFFKTVKVVPRPKVLFVTEKSSSLASDLGDIYDLTILEDVPSNLDDYMATVLNDIPANKFLQKLDQLSDYVSDGNGLLVVGGQNSYDRGGYKGSLVETLLPVKVGAGEESEKSDVYIVIVIDISHGTAEYVNVEKAQAVSVIESLDEKNNVGVIAFNTVPYRVADIKPLSQNKDELTDKVSRLVFDGQSFFNLGLDSANKLLRSVSGSKNIILITDGKTTYNKLMLDTKEAARQAAARGIKVYVAGVGANRNDDFLTQVAAFGEGIYFPVDASNKLKILFGEPEGTDEQDYLNKLVMLDTTHFITFNQSLDAVVSGYNYVIPKPAARLLVTTNKNIPVMVAWRFGLGRVISLATDDGGKWAGELLSNENSRILTKSINWVIGDLSRKKNFDVTIRDSTLDDPLIVNVISDILPEHDDLTFVKADVNLYNAKYDPQSTGYYNFLGSDTAVNYKKEFKGLGINIEFLELVEQTGGRIFDKDDIDSIIEFAKEKSKRIKVDRTSIRWPFLVLAIILLLGDIGLRRWWEIKSSR